MAYNPDHPLERLMRKLAAATEKMEELNVKLSRFADGVELFTGTVVGCFLACCPFAVFWSHSVVMALIDGKEPPPAPHDPILAVLAVLPLAFIPFLVIETRRAIRALGDEDIPRVLWWGFLAVFFTPFFIVPLAREYGAVAYFAALAWWPIGTLSPAAFVIAAAQVDAERRGEKVRVTFLKLLWHAGGFVGVILAMRMFRESKAIEKFETGLPRVVVFILIAVVLALVAGIPDVPRGALWAPFQPQGP